jgi:hypothetical protein
MENLIKQQQNLEEKGKEILQILMKITKKKRKEHIINMQMII